jgi:hypothetical protein
MPQPTVSTSSPLDGATDVFINKPLTVTFNAALTSTTVTNTSVSLINAATDSVVACLIEYVTSSNSVQITPLSYLGENTVYKIRFPGTDVALNSNFVIKDSASSTLLVTTITISFTTGSKTFIDDTSINKSALNLSLEGDINLPTHVKALGKFSVQSTIPINHSSDVSTTLDGNNRVKIVFNKGLSGALVSTDWITVDAFPMLDNPAFLASGTTLNTGTIATMTGVLHSGSSLYLLFNGEMPKNVGVNITLYSGIIASDGSEFGPNNYILSFTTDRYPKVSGIHSVKTEIKAAADELNNEYIASLLLKNTIEASQGVAIDSNPSYLITKWVMLKTIIDILDDKELEKALVAGTRRQLGDLNVSVDGVVGKLALKHARAIKELDNTKRAVFGAKYLGAVVNEYIIKDYTPTRLWYGIHGKLLESKWATYQGNYPSANAAINRQAKVPPGTDWF